MNGLCDHFPGNVISQGVNITWPPKSPDLEIPNFFLWVTDKKLDMGCSPQLTVLRSESAINGYCEVMYGVLER